VTQPPNQSNQQELTRPRTFEAYGDLRFRMHQASWVTSSLAMQMAQLARPWLAYHISDSALMLGVVAASQGLAQVIAAPFGGLAADRLPKRTVLMGSQIVLLVMVTVMATLVALDAMEVWHLALLAVVHGITVTFNNPVRQAFIPLLLPRRLLANGMALHNGARSLNQIGGPALVGVLLEVEIAIAFFVMVGLHATSVALSIRLPRGTPEPSAGRSITGELIFGLRYAANHRVIRVLVLLSILATILVQPYHALLPVFQVEVLDVGESQLGLMFAAVGFGALVSSVVVATYSHWLIKSWAQIISGAFFGVTVIALALSPWYLLTLLALFATGAAAQVFSVANSTLMMYHAEPGLYGRVAGLHIWIRALMSISLLGFGAAIDAYSAPAAVATGGVAFIACVILITLAFPHFRRSDASSPAER
jgi:MFS family permease